MRMRKRKNCGIRLENCRDLFMDNIADYKYGFDTVFDNSNPVHLEIGCGKGKFICETAKLNPNINYIAFEKCADVIVLAAEKVMNEGLTNVRFVLGDANVLNDFELNNKINRIYINFCDPWKKNKQAKRRLTHQNFLKIYARLLSSGGEVHFKTDNTKLFEFSLNSFADFGVRLKNITLDLHNSKFEGNVMTEYETRFSELGQPIYRLEAVFNV